MRLSGGSAEIDRRRPAQLPDQRAAVLADAGPSGSTSMNRAICMAITNG